MTKTGLTQASIPMCPPTHIHGIMWTVEGCLCKPGSWHVRKQGRKSNSSHHACVAAVQSPSCARTCRALLFPRAPTGTSCSRTVSGLPYAILLEVGQGGVGRRQDTPLLAASTATPASGLLLGGGHHSGGVSLQSFSLHAQGGSLTHSLSLAL